MSYSSAIMSRRRLKSKVVSPAQKVFAREVARTGNIRSALLTAYTPPENQTPKELDQAAKKLVSEPKIRNAVLKIWEEEGLTISAATKRHLRILKSKGSKDKDVLNAIDMVYRGHGIYKTERDVIDENPQRSMINIFIQQSKERGLEIPAEILEQAE